MEPLRHRHPRRRPDHRPGPRQAARATGTRLVAVAARDRSGPRRSPSQHGIEKVARSLPRRHRRPRGRGGLQPAGQQPARAVERAGRLAAGKHVFTEKPSASNATEAAEVAAVRQRHRPAVLRGVPLPVAPARRPAARDPRERRLGELQHVESRHGHAGPRRRRPPLVPRAAGGALMDLGCYSLHSMRVLAPFVGGEPTLVSAKGGERAGHPGIDEWLTAELAFPNGVTGSAGCNMASDHHQMSHRLVGTAGRGGHQGLRQPAPRRPARGHHQGRHPHRAPRQPVVATPTSSRRSRRRCAAASRRCPGRRRRRGANDAPHRPVLRGDRDAAPTAPLNRSRHPPPPQRRTTPMTQTAPDELMATCWSSAGDAASDRADLRSPLPLRTRVEAAVGRRLHRVRAAERRPARRHRGVRLPGIRDLLADNGMVHLELESIPCWWDDGEHRAESDRVRHLLLEAAEVLRPRHLKVTPDGDNAPWDRGRVGREVRRARGPGPGCRRPARHRVLPVGQRQLAGEGLRLVEEAGHDNGGVIIDAWHIARANTPVSDLATVPLQRIIGVELNDADPDVVGTLVRGHRAPPPLLRRGVLRPERHGRGPAHRRVDRPLGGRDPVRRAPRDDRRGRPHPRRRQREARALARPARHPDPPTSGPVNRQSARRGPSMSTDPATSAPHYLLAGPLARSRRCPCTPESSALRRPHDEAPASGSRMPGPRSRRAARLRRSAGSRARCRRGSGRASAR